MSLCHCQMSALAWVDTYISRQSSVISVTLSSHEQYNPLLVTWYKRLPEVTLPFPWYGPYYCLKVAFITQSQSPCDQIAFTNYPCCRNVARFVCWKKWGAAPTQLGLQPAKVCLLYLENLKVTGYTWLRNYSTFYSVQFTFALLFKVIVLLF